MDPETRGRIDGLMRELDELAASPEFERGWHLSTTHRRRICEILQEIEDHGDRDSFCRALKTLRRTLMREPRPMEG